MNRILLADDSPHAQRMGERILREEGFEVVSLTDGETTLSRLADVDPDLILADVFLPGKSGLDLCRHIKNTASQRHIRVVLTAGLLEPFDEAEATRAGCDAILKKPFEASKLLETIQPLVKEAQVARGQYAEQRAVMAAAAAASVSVTVSRPPVSNTATQIDPERVRAAVTLALDAAMPELIREITERVLIALGD
ncbi:MAG TPA: response regulator [Bryobacteraceae bacterium]|nr:response regulator [Bryobacteraceae bacterium]